MSGESAAGVPSPAYTITQLSRLLGVSRQTIHKWVNKKMLTPRRVLGLGKRLRVTREDALRLLLRHDNRALLARLGWAPTALLVGLPAWVGDVVEAVLPEAVVACEGAMEAGRLVGRHEPLRLLVDLRADADTRLALAAVCKRRRTWMRVLAVVPDADGLEAMKAAEVCDTLLLAPLDQAELAMALTSEGQS